jgi:xanthine dehydrogenase accessory factor
MRALDQVLSAPPSQAEWPIYGLVDDVRPAIQEVFDGGNRGALVTLVGVDGPSPRPLGAQMLVTSDHRAAGYVSGGCIEGSLEVICQEVMATGQARRVSFGANSPFIDVHLLCGTSIDLVVEPIAQTDPTWWQIRAAKATRTPITRSLNSDGVAEASPVFGSPKLLDKGGISYSRCYLPATRIIVFGSDPVALALLQLGGASGLETWCVRPLGPDARPPFPVTDYSRTDIAGDSFDAWTAVITTTHDLDKDHQVLARALASDAFYVGALGSLRKREERVLRLRDGGLEAQALDRLRAPVGLNIGAATPYEIAISILADIIAHVRA